MRVFLSLGSNLGDKILWLKSGISELQKILHGINISSVYQTSPVDSNQTRKQPTYYNLVISGYTNENPEKFHEHTKEIESMVTNQAIEKGYPPQIKIDKGPRYLDIDIIFFGELVWNKKKLVIPHSNYSKRLFVLVPLLELDATLSDPVSKQTLVELKQIGNRQGIFKGQEIQAIPISI